MPQSSSSFKENQLRYTRVQAAYAANETLLRTAFAEAGMDFEGFHLFLQGFKKERILEVWAKNRNQAHYSLFRSFPFCASSGTLGPKLKEGDLQIPEGIYRVDRFNPRSNFYLSLGINYPNSADRIWGDPRRPGGEIFIHGGCETVGCIPLTDEVISALYVLAVEARSNGQEKIPVHLFPDRLELGVPEQLAQQEPGNQRLINFWKNLQTIYLDFKANRTLEETGVDQTGAYFLMD